MALFVELSAFDIQIGRSALSAACGRPSGSESRPFGERSTTARIRITTARPILRDRPYDAAAKNAFLDLASAGIGVCQVRLHNLAMREYQAKVNAAVAAASASIVDCADGESYAEKLRLAISDIPAPPKLGCSREELLADGIRGATELPEIPPRLLHVPGFIDDLVEYTLATAYKPNRTLVFAGALALLGHLASRKYYDRRRTRTNLFVLAAIGTGIARRICATLTPTAIEDGFVGRCLVFDSEVEGEDNTFESDPVPIPASVLAMTEEFANRAEGPGWRCGSMRIEQGCPCA